MAEEKGKEEVKSDLGMDLTGFLSDDMASALGIGETKGEEKSTEKKEDDDFNSVLESRVAVKKEEIEEESEEVKEVKEKETKSKTVVEEKEKSPSQDKEQSEDSSKVFSLAFAKVLAERGTISELTDERLKELEETYKTGGETGNYAVLEKIVADEIEVVRGQMLATYEDDIKDYIELLDAGVDKTTAIDLMKDRKAIDGITTEQLTDNEEVRKNVLFNYYKATTRFPDAKINKMIDALAKDGDDIGEAETALTELKDLHKQRMGEEKQKVADEEKATKERIEAQKKQIVETIDKTEEIFKGVKIAKGTREELKNMILKPAGQDAQGNPLNAIGVERSKNTVEFDMRLAYLIKQGAFKGDFSKIGKIAASKSMEELEGILKNNGKAGFTPNTDLGPKDKDADKNIKDLERLFKL